MHGSLLTPVLLFAFFLSMGGSAHAGQVEIQYEIDAIGEQIPMNGTMTLVFPASGLNTLTTGTGTFATFNVQGSGFTNYGNFLGKNFFLIQSFQANANPTMLFGATLAPVLGYAAGLCTPGFYCIAQSGSASVAGHAAVAGNGAFYSATPGSGPGSITAVQWTGQEVQRTFMPEPSAKWTVPAATLSLLALFARRRQRDRQSVA